MMPVVMLGMRAVDIVTRADLEGALDPAERLAGRNAENSGRFDAFEDARAEFDQVAIVYYPGVDYFQKLMRSRYFNGIVEGKQPGDTLAMPTVPILGRL